MLVICPGVEKLCIGNERSKLWAAEDKNGGLAAKSKVCEQLHEFIKEFLVETIKIFAIIWHKEVMQQLLQYRRQAYMQLILCFFPLVLDISSEKSEKTPLSLFCSQSTICQLHTVPSKKLLKVAFSQLAVYSFPEVLINEEIEQSDEKITPVAFSCCDWSPKPHSCNQHGDSIRAKACDEGLVLSEQTEQISNALKHSFSTIEVLALNCFIQLNCFVLDCLSKCSQHFRQVTGQQIRSAMLCPY